MQLNLIVIQPDRTKGVAIDEFTVGIRIYITRFLSVKKANRKIHEWVSNLSFGSKVKVTRLICLLKIRILKNQGPN